MGGSDDDAGTPAWMCPLSGSPVVCDLRVDVLEPMASRLHARFSQPPHGATAGCSHLIALLREAIDRCRRAGDSKDEAALMAMCYKALWPHELVAAGDALPAHFRSADHFPRYYAERGGEWQVHAVQHGMRRAAELVGAMAEAEPQRRLLIVVVGAGDGIGIRDVALPQRCTVMMYDVNPIGESGVLRCRGDETPLPGIPAEGADVILYTACVRHPGNAPAQCLQGVRQLRTPSGRDSPGGHLLIVDFLGGEGMLGMDEAKCALGQLAVGGCLGVGGGVGVGDRTVTVNDGRHDDEVRILETCRLSEAPFVLSSFAPGPPVTLVAGGLQRRTVQLSSPGHPTAQRRGRPQAPAELIRQLPPLQRLELGTDCLVTAHHHHGQVIAGQPVAYVNVAQGAAASSPVLTYVGSSDDEPTRACQHAGLSSARDGNRHLVAVCSGHSGQALAARLVRYSVVGLGTFHPALLGADPSIHRVRLLTRLAEQAMLYDEGLPAPGERLSSDSRVTSANGCRRVFSNFPASSFLGRLPGPQQGMPTFSFRALSLLQLETVRRRELSAAAATAALPRCVPDGWTFTCHVYPGGKPYKRYSGPNGERAPSLKQALIQHASKAETSTAAAASGEASGPAAADAAAPADASAALIAPGAIGDADDAARWWHCNHLGWAAWHMMQEDGSFGPTGFAAYSAIQRVVAKLRSSRDADGPTVTQVRCRGWVVELDVHPGAEELVRPSGFPPGWPHTVSMARHAVSPLPSAATS